MLDRAVGLHACMCTVCCAPFTNCRRIKYCGQLCRSRGYNAARKADGRLAAQRIQLAEYNRQYLGEYRRRSQRPVPCVACGVPVQRSHLHRGGRRPACSGWCMGYLRSGKWPCSLVPDKHPSRSTLIPRDHPSRGEIARCYRCNREYIQITGQRYCTQRCKQAARAGRREIRERGAFIADVSPLAIYERDGWRCQLCWRKVARHRAVPHPKAPTLDHIIPLARGGTHEPSNVHTAHFICNARKGDRGSGEQFLLFG